MRRAPRPRNHWGLTRTPEGLLRIADAIDSPWLGVLMDTGTSENPTKLEKIAPRQPSCRQRLTTGGEWYTLDLDYKDRSILKSELRRPRFIEFEGKPPPTKA